MLVRALAAILRPWARRVRIEGLSMIPTYAPGEYVWAVRRFAPLRVGDVVAVANVGGISGEVVKRVSDITGQQVALRGDNEAVSVDSRHFGLIDMAEICWIIRPQKPAIS